MDTQNRAEALQDWIRKAIRSADREQVRKGSWRWSAHIAEIIAWGTTTLLFAVVNVADMPGGTYRAALVIVIALALWIALLFRVLLPRGAESWVPWANLVVGLGFACVIYAALRFHVQSAQLVFVPVVLATGLLGHLGAALTSALLSVAGYLAVAAITGPLPGAVGITITAGLFLLSGSVAGLLSTELRSHYRAEQEEHGLATAVRLRLLAVLDAVDEGIVFSDRQGVVRLVNRRAADLFDMDVDEFLGVPVVQLLRTVARLTEDPEGFMEIFQQLRDDPDVELRKGVEQIIPARRQLRLYSGPTFDDAGVLVGRIDVYTDITESVRRSAEIEELYERARKTAESYQRSLLPDVVPDLPRVSMVAHYIAAAGSRAVCGDFYDFMLLQDGRVGLVLGDVCGIGPSAASDAALTRYTLRSLAAQDSEPGILLQRFNQHVGEQLSAERFVRLLIGVLDAERAVFEYANAGHVPPVLYKANTGTAQWLGEGGIAAGVEAEASYKVGRVDLEPGDMLVLYTDGVTEAHRHGRPFGQGKFLDIVTTYGIGTPGELTQAIRRAVDSWTSENELRDDLALLVCQVVPDEAVGAPVRELVLPNDPSRIREVRSFVGTFLADVRAPIEASSDILLAVNEAAANAARHGRHAEGRSEMRVRCSLSRPDVVVTVADDGPGMSVDRADDVSLPDRFASGGRGLFLMRQLMDRVHIDTSSDGTTVTLTRSVIIDT